MTTADPGTPRRFWPSLLLRLGAVAIWYALVHLLALFGVAMGSVGTIFSGVALLLAASAIDRRRGRIG